jgi:hypothetical protein
MRNCSFSVKRENLPLLGIFFIGVFVRALPEFYSGSYPVGYDVLQGYIPSILALPDITPMRLFGWAYSPLAIYILWFVYALTKISPYLLLKIAGPLFYGFFCASFYCMLNKGLGWKTKAAAFVALLLLFEPAILRTGWDQLREMLALTTFFMLLAQTKCNLISSAKSKPFLVSFLTLVIVFSHQLIAVLLLIIVLWQMLKNRPKELRNNLKPVAVFAPSALVFSWQIYSQFISPSLTKHLAPFNLPTGTGTFVFTNYFLSDPRFQDGNYSTLLLYVGSLALFTVAPLFPFAMKGFFKDKVFTPMICWLLVASFSIVIYPSFALSNYWWWMLLLTIPLTVYAGNFLNKVKVFDNKRRFGIASIALIAISIVSMGYAISAIRIGNSYSYTNIPSGMVETSIHFEDIPNAENAIKWVNEKATSESIIIVPEKIQGQAYRFISDARILVAQPFLTLNTVLSNAKLNATDIFAVYFHDEVGSNLNLTKIAIFGPVEVYQVLPSDMK